MKFQSLALIMSLVVGYGLQAAHAVDAPIKLAIVDMQKALESAEAGKTARSELEKDFAKKQKRVQEDEEELKKLNEDFQKQSLVMNEAARNKRQAELQKKLMEYQQNAMASQTDIQKRQAQLTEPIINGLRDTVAELAKKNNYTVVLEKSRMGVLYSMDKDDITDQVIKIYNDNNKKKK